MNIFKKLFGKTDIQKIKVENNSDSIDVEKVYQSTIKILDRFKKTAFLPTTEKNKNTFSEKSKIGDFLI